MGQALTRLSLQEFLDWENQQPERHEFHRGEVFAMVGARRVHGLIALNLKTAVDRFPPLGPPHECTLFCPRQPSPHG